MNNKDFSRSGMLTNLGLGLVLSAVLGVAGCEGTMPLQYIQNG